MTQENSIIAEGGVHVFRMEWKTWERHITIQWPSDVSLFFLVHDAAMKLTIDVASEHARVGCSILVVSSWNITSSIDFSVALKASHTIADVYALSLLGNNAKAQVNGGVVIGENIIQAQGYLAEENLLLGKKIQIKALPMLDVRSNDVKASHGATISRLDDQKLFYLTAKWLSPETAERLMVQSYIQKALDHAKIEDETLVENVFQKLS